MSDDKLKEFTAQNGGIIDCTIVWREQIPEFIIGSMAGNITAIRFLICLSRRRPLPGEKCWCCCGEIKPDPAAFVFLHPPIDGEVTCMICPVCSTCAKGTADEIIAAFAKNPSALRIRVFRSVHMPAGASGRA